MEADMINSPEELVYAVQDTLAYWKDIHTDANAWAVEWSDGGNYTGLLVSSPEIGNKYFTFDLLTACQVMLAEDWMLVRCTQCGSLRSSYDECLDAWEADWDDEDDLLELDDSQPVELDAEGVLRISGSKIG